MKRFQLILMMVVIQLEGFQNEIYATDTNAITDQEEEMLTFCELLQGQNNVRNLKKTHNSSTCPIQNFTVVSVVHNGTSKYINLLLSWEEFDDQAVITVKSDLSKVDCYKEYIDVNHRLDDNSLLLPDSETSEEIKPGCKYEISITSNTNEIYSCTYNYTVPECVEDMYNCDNFKSQPKILSVDSVIGDKFLVKWDPGEKTVNNYSFETKLVDFHYKPDQSFTELAEVIIDDLEDKTSVVSMKLIEGDNYTLIGIFHNNFSCSTVDKLYFIAPTKPNYNRTIIIVAVILLFGVVIALKYKKITKYKNKIFDFIIPQRREEREQRELTRLKDLNIAMTTNLQYTPVEFEDKLVDEYEFPKNKIIMKELIGSGAFGYVYSAKALGLCGTKGSTIVAVKTLGEGGNITKEATNDFIAEIEIFKKIGQHRNIVALLGCCTLEPPYMMIMEFVPCGDLKSYLLELRKQWLQNKIIEKGGQVFFSDNSDGAYVGTAGSPNLSVISSRLASATDTVFTTLEDPMSPPNTYILEKNLDNTELQTFAFQIASGMAHLEKIEVTHRDLAARNILINEYKILKISDFGLSRSGPYINHRTKKLPLRWMAIEAIVDQKYDNKSDVWSFGVVLWEIGTLGAFPYESVPDAFIQQFLQMGRRLERPEICTDELYSLMKECWATDPEKRPTFQDLVDALDVKKRKVYVNFDQLNPTYVFPSTGTENLIRIVDIDA